MSERSAPLGARTSPDVCALADWILRHRKLSTGSLFATIQRAGADSRGVLPALDDAYAWTRASHLTQLRTHFPGTQRLHLLSCDDLNYSSTDPTYPDGALSGARICKRANEVDMEGGSNCPCLGIHPRYRGVADEGPTSVRYSQKLLEDLAQSVLTPTLNPLELAQLAVDVSASLRLLDPVYHLLREALTEIVGARIGPAAGHVSGWIVTATRALAGASNADPQRQSVLASHLLEATAGAHRGTAYLCVNEAVLSGCASLTVYARSPRQLRAPEMNLLVELATHCSLQEAVDSLIDAGARVDPPSQPPSLGPGPASLPVRH